MRRKWLLLGAGGALLPYAAVGVLLLYSRRGPPEAKLAHVHKGMSMAQVQAILGRPPDEIGGKPTGMPEPPLYDHPRGWREAGWPITVEFDQNGKVSEVSGWGREPAPSAIDRLYKWLGW